METSDAVLDLIVFPFFRLLRQEGVGQRSPAHADEIGFAHPQQGFRHLGIVDPVGQNHRDVQQIFDLLGSVHVKGVVGEHRGDDLVPGMGGIHAVGYVDSVKAQLLEVEGKFIAFRLGAAALYKFFPGKADDQRKVRANGLAHAGVDFVDDPNPVLETSAVLVGSLVHIGGQKPRQQVTVGAVKLNAVEAGFFAAGGGNTEILYQLVDFFLGHGSGKFKAHRVFGAGGRYRHDSAVYRFGGLPAGMVHLAEDFGAVLIEPGR